MAQYPEKQRLDTMARDLRLIREHKGRPTIIQFSKCVLALP